MRHVAMLGLAVLVSFPLTLAAQEYATDRGSFILGGSASFVSQGGDLYENLDGDRLNTLTLNPYLLYFITPGLGIGGELALSRASQGDSDATVLGVGPTVAYYFGGPEASVRPFVEAHAAYLSLDSDFGDATGWGAGAGAGAAFMLTRAVALTVGAVFEVHNLSIDDFDEDGNEFRIEAGIAAFLF